MEEYTYKNSKALFKRALNVIPGGIYGSKSPGFVVPGAFPYYFEKGKGAYLWDVDGNKFIDYLCGFGSMLFGYGYDPVDEVAMVQYPKGNLLNQPGPIMVELAEKLAGRIDNMDWSVFAKNGTDVTTLAVSLARVHTDKKVVIHAKGAYHGAANWCSTNEYQVLEDKKDVVSFPYNDLDALKALYQKYKGQIACIILTPYHHPTYKNQVMPHPELYSTVAKLNKEEGALFISDDIRVNFRLSKHGSHHYFGAKPDLVTMGKCITNGYPLSVLMGNESLMKTAGSFFITGTYWTSMVPMVAAMKCLDEMERLPVIEHVSEMGTLLANGLTESAKEFGFTVDVTGPPGVPFMTFRDDPDLFSNQIFCAAMARRGIYLHPHHNWFVSYAHQQGDIDQTLEISRIAFKELVQARNEYELFPGAKVGV